MVIKPNWDIFKAKFSENPQENFEYFCYLLFCIEHNKPHGIFRYKNQSGIETNPIEVDDQRIGWQAKFYGDSLSNHKTDLLGTLTKSKRDYPSIAKIILYTNSEWGQGQSKDNDPQGKIEIQNKAKELNIILEWRTASYFESPFVSITNSSLASHFFADESTYDLINQCREHSKRILLSINESINFNSSKIIIDRDEVIKKIENQLNKNQVLILSGVGGVGKTAVIKKIYEKIKDETYLYLFKASEFNLTSIDDLFAKHMLEDFIKIHKTNKQKIFIIDSAEKILDIPNRNPFRELLSILIKEDWKIIFTTRNSYLEDLHYILVDNNVAFNDLIIENLKTEELSKISQEHIFDLPSDKKLLKLIRNPFYLNEYLKFYKKDDGIDYKRFKEKLWDINIKKSNIRREECFLKLALNRANTGKFFVHIEGESNSLEEFEREGVLGHETAGYFITHDIYEEWALEKKIGREFINKNNNLDFFQKIGSSLPIRRSFRNWISEKLLLNDEIVNSFVEGIVDDEKIENFWKDEILISILLSDNSDSFFKTFRRELLNNTNEILDRGSFLLRLACKKADNSFYESIGVKLSQEIEMPYIFTQPRGNGWGSFIGFIYENLDNFKLRHIEVILPILNDWNSKYPKGKTTYNASLIALEYYKLINNTEGYKYRGLINDICKVIVNGTYEIKDELDEIFNLILKNKWVDQSENYYELSKMILSGFDGLIVSKNLPKSVIKLAGLFWIYTPKQQEQGMISFYESEDTNIETAYGIEKYRFEYSPSSAFQTPILTLLSVDFEYTINFIVSFINKSVEKYAYSKYGREVEEVEIYIDGNTIKQYHSSSLWNMYRTSTSSTLMQSIHMALEKRLLEIAKVVEKNILESWLRYLLKKSKSSSISAVVTSIVLAYPDKTFNIAVILFQTKEFFREDLMRALNERTSKSLCGIGYSSSTIDKIYNDERLKTYKDKHRKWSLENLFLNYQFLKNEGVTDKEIEARQHILWKNLDDYYFNLPSKGEQTENDMTWRIALGRMDKRKMDVEVEEKEKGFQLTFNPELPTELVEYIEGGKEEREESTRYISLRLWSKNKVENNSDYKKYLKYEENPIIAIQELKELKELLTILPKNPMYGIYKSTVSDTSVVMLRDYHSELSKENKEFCKDILLECAISPFSDNYFFQISDGTKSAISFLPLLIRYFPELEDDVKLILFINFLNVLKFNINGSKISNYVITAITTYYNEENYHSFVIGYLTLKRIYDIQIKKIREMQRAEYEPINYQEHFRNFINENENILNSIVENKIENEEVGLETTNIETLIVILNLISKKIGYHQNSNFLLEVLNKLSFEISKIEEHKLKHEIKSIFSDSLANILLNTTEKNHLKLLLNAIKENMKNTQLITSIFTDIVFKQDIIKKYNNFWYIWEFFEDKITVICKDSPFSRETSTIINIYLLAWTPHGAMWKDSAKEWHSLKDENKRFFQRICRAIGDNPTTLYAISKLLTGIGSSFLNSGISWIAEMINKNKILLTSELETITIHHLETLSRKYILKNNELIKKDINSKNNILIILNFLVKKGSATGYMLRERIY